MKEKSGTHHHRRTKHSTKGDGNKTEDKKIKIVDLYTALKAAHRALQDGRYKLFLEAKEHFLKKEYQYAHDKFKEIFDNLVLESYDHLPGGKSIKTAEALANHLHHDLLRRLRLEKKRQHINFVANEINLLDQCLYPTKIKSESQVRTLLDS